MQACSYMNIDITGGFWKERQNTVVGTTIYSVYDRFKDTGRFNSLRHEWKEGMENKPHIFWDSDVAKWLESVAYIIKKHPDARLEEIADGIIDMIDDHQGFDGYFNTYFTVVDPQDRFTRRTDHELYCAGHLMEAAVAYFEATGKDKLLKTMEKYADLIDQIFIKDKSAGFTTPGHEEIELALYRMYKVTDNKKYLQMARFFIDNKGTGADDGKYYKGFAKAAYSQDHLPVRLQTTAEGHSVRAVYLYSAMADIARECSDSGLYNACREIFDNIVNKRMYITGGIGSSSAGEAFTIDYDLPSLTAYAETCAALGLALFAGRMLLTDVNSIYSDTIERVIYNGFLSGLSIDGKSFFYENPLELQPWLAERDVSVTGKSVRLPISQRKEVFDCSCCPPNVTRFIASIGNFIYTYDEDTLYVHQYIDSNGLFNINGNDLTAELRCAGYPADGIISFKTDGGVKRLAFRVPYWAEEYCFTVNGKNVKPEIIKGYAYINANGQTEVNIDFKVECRLMEASPYMAENAGKAAVMRGPVVYCAEEADNGKLIKELIIDRNPVFELTECTGFNAPILPAITATGVKRDVNAYEGTLYTPLKNSYVKTNITLIPYYAFANRGEGEMAVWLNLLAM